ncbi:MAG: hypothetical protein WCP09_01390 [Candidatus Taylorbacteria bacterium]
MKNGQILIFTNKDEKGIDKVLSTLDENHQQYTRINVNSIIGENDISLTESSDGLSISSNSLGLISTSKQISSVWYRRPENPIPTNTQKLALENQELDLLKTEWASFFWSLYTTLGGYWINPPLFGTKLFEHNKLYQTQLARKVGLAVPKTIISNCPEELIRFAQNCGGIVAIKAIKQRIFENLDGTYDGIYTNKISADHLSQHREDLSVCPVMLQEYIQKKVELRVTIVGNHVFTCTIDSQNSERTKVDWRKYDFENVGHEKSTLPDNIRDKLLTFMRQSDLVFGAIDMILTPSGEYVFLEVNPNGQYGWIEALTGMPISAAIADVLSNPIA